MSIRFYLAYNTRAESLVDTWMCCASIGKWFVWLRLFGMKLGVDVTL